MGFEGQSERHQKYSFHWGTRGKHANSECKCLALFSWTHNLHLLTSSNRHSAFIGTQQTTFHPVWHSIFYFSPHPLHTHPDRRNPGHEGTGRLVIASTFLHVKVISLASRRCLAETLSPPYRAPQERLCHYPQIVEDEMKRMSKSEAQGLWLRTGGGGEGGVNPCRGVLFQDPFYGALWWAYTACCPTFSGPHRPYRMSQTQRSRTRPVSDRINGLGLTSP